MPIQRILQKTRNHDPLMRYRPEIDGLRALAVILVIFFHAGFQFFSGGFVGVDIFFVISGYLITAIVLAELEDGRFSILNFYERRARRILPALYLVMAVCLPFAWLWLMPSDLSEFLKSTIAVLGFTSNIFFWRHSDYFDPVAELKPLLHTWSLGIEEQFYMLFPAFLLFAWRLGRKRIMVLLTIVSLLSLALAQYGASVQPAPTFFLLPTRGWELAMGSVIAFYLKDKEHGHFSPALYQILSLVGFGLIVFGLMVLNKDTPFPSAYALVPTVGAGLIIAFAVPSTFVGRLLGSKVCAGVGLVSYSAYLWHQPLLSFARHRSLTEPDDYALVLVVILTFCLAYVTWRYVEQPFRHKNIVTRKLLWRSALASAIVIAAFAVELQPATSKFQSKLKKETQELVRVNTCMFELEQTFKTLLHNQCDVVPASAVQAGFEQSRTSQIYVLFGDSIAAHLYPGLLRLADENKIIQLTGGACKVIRSAIHRMDKRCADFYDWFVDEYIPSNKVNAIILSSDWFNTYQKLGDKEFRVGLINLFEKLKGNRVVIYSQPASLSTDVHRYLYKIEKFLINVPNLLEVDARSLTAVNSALREESLKFGFEFMDVSQLFCSEARCVVAKDGVLYFSDTIHLTLLGSARVAEATYSLLTSVHAEQLRGVQDDPKKDGILYACAIIVRNLDGTIRYWSEGAKNLYGWEPQVVQGKVSHHIFDTIFPFPLKVIEEELRAKGHWQGQLIHERSDGSKITVTSHWDLQKLDSENQSNTVVEINSNFVPEPGAPREGTPHL